MQMRMSNGGRLCGMLVCTGILLLTGCRSSSRGDVIVAVPLTASGPPMMTERTGIQEAANEHRLKLDWNGPSERNAQWQVDALHKAVRDHPYGIIVTPYSAFGLNITIREAIAHRIPVVVVASPLEIPPTPYLSFVLEDTRAGARLVQRRLQTLTGDTGEVALLGIDPESNGSDQRAAALEQALREHSPSIRVVDRVRGPMSFGYLEIAAEKLLQQHPRLDAIVTMTARAGTSTAEAIRRIHPRHPVRLIVYDGTFPAMLLLRHNEVDSILIQDLRGMGYRAVQNLVANHQGRPVASSVFFPPQLATRDNVDSEAIQQLMLQHWEPQ
jgi:ribose transport system substrate-binding protein